MCSCASLPRAARHGVFEIEIVVPDLLPEVPRTRSTARCCAKTPATEDWLHASYRPRRKRCLVSHPPGFVQAALQLPEHGFAVSCRQVQCGLAFHLAARDCDMDLVRLALCAHGRIAKDQNLFPQQVLPVESKPHYLDPKGMPKPFNIAQKAMILHPFWVQVF